MQNSPHFVKPVVGYRSNDLKKKAWKKSLDAFEAGKYVQVFDALIEYLNPEHITRKHEHGNTEIIIPHGCLHLHITITPEHYQLKVPFLKTDKPSIGLMNQITKLNMNDLALTQVYFQNGQFYFYYESPLALCHPNKLYDTMKQMCVKGDNVAEQWARELDATLIETPFTYALNSDQKQVAWTLFTSQINQLEQYIQYFEQKHWEGHVWVIFSVVLRYIDFVLNPRGRLRREILADVSDFTQDVAARDKASRAPDLLAKYRGFSQEEFLSCIYIPHQLFRDRSEQDLATIHKDLNTCYDYLMKEKPGDAYGTIYILLYWLRLPYYYDLSPFMRQCISHHLLNARDLPWDKAYKKLWAAMQEVRRMRVLPKNFLQAFFIR